MCSSQEGMSPFQFDWFSLFFSKSLIKWVENTTAVTCFQSSLLSFIFYQNQSITREIRWNLIVDVLWSHSDLSQHKVVELSRLFNINISTCREQYLILDLLIRENSCHNSGSCYNHRHCEWLEINITRRGVQLTIGTTDGGAFSEIWPFYWSEHYHFSESKLTFHHTLDLFLLVSNISF